MRRSARYLLSWAVTLGLVVWIFQTVPWREVIAQGGRVDWVPLAAAAVLSLLGNVWAACQKYRLILKALGIRLTLWEVVLLKIGSIPIKNLLPFKAGELVRLLYLRRTQGVSYLRGGASVLMNFGLSVAALGMMMIPAMASFAMRGPLVWAFAAIVLIALATARALARGKCTPTSADVVNRQSRGIGGVWAAVRTLGPGGMAALLGYSLLFEGIKLLDYILVFHAMGIEVSWVRLLQMVPPLILISGLPVSIMGIGVREWGVLAAFSRLADDAGLVGAGLWVSLVEGVVPLVAGLALLKPFLGRLLSAGETRLVEEDSVPASEGGIKLAER